MNTQTLLIIIGFFAVSFLLMIPFYLYTQNKKKKESELSQQNVDDAILHIYGDNPITINNHPLSDYKSMSGKDMQKIVVLNQGKYEIGAKYTATTISMGKNQNIKTPKPIFCELYLESGYEYSLALYFYSPEERRNYYKGDVGVAVFAEAFEVANEGISATTHIYLICYKEKYRGEEIKIGL